MTTCDLAYVLLVETNPFPELVVIFSGLLSIHFEHPSVLSRFCFIQGYVMERL